VRGGEGRGGEDLRAGMRNAVMSCHDDPAMAVVVLRRVRGGGRGCKGTEAQGGEGYHEVSVMRSDHDVILTLGRVHVRSGKGMERGPERDSTSWLRPHSRSCQGAPSHQAEEEKMRKGSEGGGSDIILQFCIPLSIFPSTALHHTTSNFFQSNLLKNFLCMSSNLNQGACLDQRLHLFPIFAIQHNAFQK
jgi:hypothetical protein